MKYRIKDKENSKNYLRPQGLKDINSIENNLDALIFQKMDLILNQQKHKTLEKKIKSHKSILTRKNSSNKYTNLTSKKQEVINKRITLGKFLMQNYQEINLIDITNNNKEKEKENNIKKEDIKQNNDIASNKGSNGKEKKEETLSYFKRKERDRKKNMKTLKIDIEKMNHFKIYLNKSDHFVIQRKLSKRYTLFKTILNYLESNNITLYELLRDNPFQSKPYELSKSYDFLLAVKFKNYEYVTEALQNTKRYLFSFDYFGQTAYHWAAKLDDIKMLKLLLDFGLYHNQKDFKGRTPLYLAALNNHKEICNYLLINNGNIFLKDKRGLSPADVAGSKELKYYLYEYMAQPFSNPIYKARIHSFLKDREERIKKKKEKEKEEQLEKLKIQKEKEDNGEVSE